MQQNGTRRPSRSNFVDILDIIDISSSISISISRTIRRTQYRIGHYLYGIEILSIWTRHCLEKQLKVRGIACESTHYKRIQTWRKQQSGISISEVRATERNCAEFIFFAYLLLRVDVTAEKHGRPNSTGSKVCSYDLLVSGIDELTLLSYNIRVRIVGNSEDPDILPHI